MKAEATIASSTLDLARGKTAVQRGKNIESRLAPQWGSRVFVSGIPTVSSCMDAKDDRAAHFYLQYGFVPANGNPLKLYLLVW